MSTNLTGTGAGAAQNAFVWVSAVSVEVMYEVYCVLLCTHVPTIHGPHVLLNYLKAMRDGRL